MPELEVEGFPFILIDKVLGRAPGERAIGLRNVTANDPLLRTPGEGPASMRRSLLIEAFSQLASLALVPKKGVRNLFPGRPEVSCPQEVATKVPDTFSGRVEIARIESMRFVRSPVPGDQLVLTVEFAAGAPPAGGSGLRVACKAEVGGELIAEGTLELERP